MSGKSFAQQGALLIGAAYLAIGIAGFFVTGFDHFTADGTDKLLGFGINPFHNLVHLSIGAYLMLVARFENPVTEGALIGGGLVYLVAAFLGFGNHAQILSIHSSMAADNYLHLSSGVAALGLGLFSAMGSGARARTA
jgi:hypothetical protein